MPDIYGILNVATRSLLTQQKAIDVTGQNIANVNTPGYSRQRVVMEPSTPINFEPGQMGTGVKAAEIQRIYDSFIGGQISGENSKLGQWEATESGLSRIELIFNESSGAGLEEAMSQFWAAWQDLASNPSGYPERTALLTRSQTLARTFNTMSANLEQIQRDYDQTIVGTVDEINGISRQIVDLNEKISQVEIAGQNSNDYRDQRDQLLKELSKLIDINTYENDQGQVTVMTASGNPLVQSPYAYELSTITNTEGFQDVVWMNRSGATIDITDSIESGELKGWLDVRDGFAQDYMDRLDELASTMIAEVNAIHQTGFGMTIDSATRRSGNGAALFRRHYGRHDGSRCRPLQGMSIGSPPSATAATVPGDNTNAIEMANLQGRLTMNGTSTTFDSYYSALASGVGNDVSNASANADYEDAMVSHLENYRESVSGVSLDEEMVNLVKFQHAYQAAAKLITTVDDMLNTVLNMI